MKIIVFIMLIVSSVIGFVMSYGFAYTTVSNAFSTGTDTVQVSSFTTEK